MSAAFSSIELSTLMKKSPALGLLSGLILVVLTLIAIGIVNLPQAEGADSAELRGTANCRPVHTPVDQGYGITRKVERASCE